MANYCCTIRTNFFHVKDEDKFRDLMSHVYGCEDTIELWEEKDTEGKTVFGFGVYGGIAGLRSTQEDEDDIDDSSYDEFIYGLQECVADNDAIIIMEAGNEKMRYVVGFVSIITSEDYHVIDMVNLAVEKAAGMLKNDMWNTQCFY